MGRCMKLAALGVGDFRLSASGEVARGCTSARGSLPAMAALTERITVVVKIDPGTEHASIFLFLESDLLVWQALRQPDPSPSLHPAARVPSWSAFHRCARQAPNQLTGPILRTNVIAPSCTTPALATFSLCSHEFQQSTALLSYLPHAAGCARGTSVLKKHRWSLVFAL
jgi:hypothetical protein